MKLKIITLIFITASLKCLGQSTEPDQDVERHFVGLTPTSKNIIVNGLAFGLSAHPWSNGIDTLHVKINGLNIEAGPLGIIGGLWGTMYGICGFKLEDSNSKTVSFFSNYGYSDSLITAYPKFGTHLNGVSISLGGVTETYNKGLFINGLSGYCYETFGAQISGLINETYEFKGVSIAGIANVTNRGHGVQLGLINKCKTGNIIQIGLWNRIGKRVIPFMNLRISKK
jgi:hypothetical protein